jgi:hypothetical protein
MDESLELIGI